MKCRDELGNKIKQQFRLMELDGKFLAPMDMDIIINGCAANERFAILLEVDAENQEKRLQLKKEKDLLRKAQEWLEGLTENAVSDSHDIV